MVVDIRLSGDLRKLVHAFPQHKFTCEDLLDIVHKKTLAVFERHGKTGSESHIPSTNSSITENKARFLKKDTSKKSFPETPADPIKWLELLSIIKADLGLSQDSTREQLREELKRIKNKSKATKKAVNLTNADIKYLLHNIKESTDKPVDDKEDEYTKENQEAAKIEWQRVKDLKATDTGN